MGGPPGLGRLPIMPQDLAATFSLEPELRGALVNSRRVGALLLKAEEQEAASVAAAADELIKREYRWGVVVGGVREVMLNERLMGGSAGRSI